jgi:hypothetical protein
VVYLIFLTTLVDTVGATQPREQWRDFFYFYETLGGQLGRALHSVVARDWEAEKSALRLDTSCWLNTDIDFDADVCLEDEAEAGTGGAKQKLSEWQVANGCGWNSDER